MRHQASLVTELEGLSRPAYLIGKELTFNSRSGLTTRYLAKKLEMPETEVEYLIDVNRSLFFTDITKVKLVAGGGSAVRRVAEGLENRGDAEALIRRVRNMDDLAFGDLEERIGVSKPAGKKAAAEEMLTRWYRHPERIVEYVASRGFSETAQELFDLVWQAKDGVIPASHIRKLSEAGDFEVEQALWELCRGLALFEMFRFDSEERLVRVVGLLAELRQWRELEEAQTVPEGALEPVEPEPGSVDARGLSFSHRVCRLVAGVAARPVRLRSDGDLFKEDHRRLSEIDDEDAMPPLATCLWAAEGMGWLTRVDNEMRAASLHQLIAASRLERHRALFEWLARGGSEVTARKALSALLPRLQPGVWYPCLEAASWAIALRTGEEQPVLRLANGRWRYAHPAAEAGGARALVRALEETFHWLGAVERGESGGEALFRVTRLGRHLLTGEDDPGLSELHPEPPGRIVVQPNFDIVVPARDVDPLLTVPLEQFADRQSTGQATVYLLSKESFTRALQQGHDGAVFVEYLLERNRDEELPANVLRTLEDWLGSMKEVRLRTIHVLESEDPLVIADLTHRKRLAKYLSKLDPRHALIYKGVTRKALAKELEKEGFVVK